MIPGGGMSVLMSVGMTMGVTVREVNEMRMVMPTLGIPGNRRFGVCVAMLKPGDPLRQEDGGNKTPDQGSANSRRNPVHRVTIADRRTTASIR